MKKYILTLLLALTIFCANSSNLIYNNALSLKYSQYTSLCCEWLDIDSVQINIINTSLPVQGFVHKIESGSYIILVNKKHCENVYIVLAHELTHIKQDLEGKEIIESGTYSVNNDRYINKEASKLEQETVLKSYWLYNKFLKSNAINQK